MNIKRFSERTFVFSIVLALFNTLIVSIEADGNPLSGLDFLVTRIIASCIGIYLIWKLGLWAYTGFGKTNFGKGVALGIPFLIMGIVSGIVVNLGQINEYSFLGVSSLLLFTVGMFFVGLAEEIVYRGLILNNMLKKWENTLQGSWKAILVSALIFGIAHLINMFFAPVLTVLVQAINATAGGILFSAIYIKTRNIWAVITIHALVDWFALIMQVCFTGTSIISAEMSLTQAVFISLVGSLIPLFFAWLYVGRKSKYKPAV